jgi:aerobic-type carbon monoxide dehydrogenase small subunit (CoxS/CutS family)
MARPNRRIDHHGAVERGARVTITVDGEPLPAFLGETLAAAMLADGRRTLRRSPRSGSPRGIFCGMGICYDCLMVVDGRPNVRACMTPVAEGMAASVQEGPAAGVRPTPAWDPEEL